MKILIFGATGGIGSAIKEILKEHELLTMGRPDMFLSQPFDWVIFAHGTIHEKNMETIFEANLFSCIKLTEDLLPDIVKGFIYISSTAAFKGNDKFPIYAASKAALNNYTLSMAKKYPDKQFYAICPGPTETKMWRDLKLEGKPQPPSAVAQLVKDCIEGKYKGGIIGIRNGEIW